MSGERKSNLMLTIKNWRLRKKKTDVAKRVRVIDNIGLLFNEPPVLQVALYLVSRKCLVQALGSVLMPRPIALLIPNYPLPQEHTRAPDDVRSKDK